MTEDQRRKVGWPTLAVLLLFLAGAFYLVSRVHRDTLRGDPVAPGIDVDASVEESGPGYVHHDWTPDAGAPRDEPARRYDPQADLMARQFPGDASVEMPFAPLERRLTLVDVRGQPPVGAATEPCSLRVLPVLTPEHDCAVRVLCDGRPIYPNPSQTAGFNDCEIEDGEVARVRDDDPSPADGDPMLTLEVERGTVIVEERREGQTYRIRLRFAER